MDTSITHEYIVTSTVQQRTTPFVYQIRRNCNNCIEILTLPLHFSPLALFTLPS